MRLARDRRNPVSGFGFRGGAAFGQLTDLGGKPDKAMLSPDSRVWNGKPRSDGAGCMVIGDLDVFGFGDGARILSLGSVLSSIGMWASFRGSN